MECSDVPVLAGALEMKVCQLCAVDFTVENFLLPLVDGMHARGWDVTTICSDGPAVSHLRSQGYKVVTIPIERSLNPVLGLRSVLALIRLFRQGKFDVVHVHTPLAAMIGRIAAFFVGVPLIVYTAHGFYFHEAMPKWKYQIFFNLEKILGRITGLVFCQSAEDAECAVKHKFVASDKVLTIGNGVSVQRFDPARYDAKLSRKAIGIPEDAFVIGMVGRQVQEKGVGDFVQAAVKLGEVYKNVWFVLVGERLISDHNRGVDQDIDHAEQALGERLRLLGHRKDVPELLAAFDVFCLPSWREGMPRSIIEAMMMGKPVVATNIRGSREEVVHEETGLLVPTKSPLALAESLERLVRDPSWGRRAGQQGRIRALNNFDEFAVVEMQLVRIETEIGRTQT